MRKKAGMFFLLHMCIKKTDAKLFFYSYNVYGSCHAYLSLAQILCIFIKVFSDLGNLPIDFQPVPCAPLENIILMNQTTIDFKCAKEPLTRN
jgi:hypothetical protein